MPSRIPIKVLFQQCVSRLAQGLVTAIRATLVIIVWLIILPTITIWTWRFYFWSGENIGFYSTSKNSNRLLPNDSHSLVDTDQEFTASDYLLRYSIR